MRPFRYPPKTAKHDERTGDELIREWVKHCGTVSAAERKAGITSGNLRIWLFEPERGMRTETALALADASGLPVEAILFRWTPVCDLNMWKFAK